MTSFLGVPIQVRDAVYGNGYLTDKIGWSEFTSDDEALIGALAIAAGIAIENARLHQRVQEVAVFEDRDRLARNLHDTAIQRLFAIGLSLQSMATNPTALLNAGRLEQTIEDIDDTIRKVRTSIFELASGGIGRGLRNNVLALIQDLRPVIGFGVRTSFEGPVDAVVSDTVTDHLLAVVREAVTNIGRHAQATKATVDISVRDGDCRFRVVDDGIGMAALEPADGGLGLGNLRRRAEKLHGQFITENPVEGGTILIWQVPLTQ